MAVESPGNPVSVLHYAFGGGLGHLTRTCALRKVLGLNSSFATLCASQSGKTPKGASDLNLWEAEASLEQDPAAFREWISESFDRFQPQAVYVDVFPGGILGELCDFPWPGGVQLILVARILNWESYSTLLRGALPRYSRSLITEPLPPGQIRILERISDSVIQVDLDDARSGPLEAPIADTLLRWNSIQQPIWLIVHSGPDSETAELLAYSRECAAIEGLRPHYVVASPGHPLPHESDLERIDIQPVSPLFHRADRLITACGCNSVRETLPWRDKHRSIPFPRRFDDQFLRKRMSQHRAFTDSSVDHHGSGNEIVKAALFPLEDT